MAKDFIEQQKIINRQQAEIEYLQGEREVLLEDIKASSNQVIEQQTEIERLKKGWKADVIETENIKTEAINAVKEAVLKRIFPYECLR